MFFVIVALMAKQYTMYLDESGQSSLADFKDKYFVLTGLIVEDKTDAELSTYFRHIKRRHGIGEETSLHAYDLFENEKSDIYFSDNEKCKKFIASIVEFVENAPFYNYVFFIDKEEIRKKVGAPRGYTFKGSKKHKEDKGIPYEILTRKLIFEFAKILKRQKAIGSIVAESRRGADVVVLRAYLDTQQHSLFEKENSLKKQSESAEERIHSVCFAGKRSLKGGLELVDVISYLAYNHLIGKLPNRKKDRKGLHVSWEKIKERINKKTPQQIKGAEMGRLVVDRIDEISKRVEQRLAEFRDLVNPTLR